MSVAQATIRIAQDSPVPIYRQIAAQIRMYIENGSLSAGDALPSVRSLASQLGIHFNTAAEAYRELAQEGSIALVRGKRATVAAQNSTLPVSEAEVDGLRQRLRHLLAEMRLKGVPGAAIRDDLEAVVGR